MTMMPLKSSHIIIQGSRQFYLVNGFLKSVVYMQNGVKFRSAHGVTTNNANLIKKIVPPMNILEETEAKNIQSVLSLDIGLTNISFSQLSRDFKLINWGVLELNRQRPFIASKYVQTLNEIVEELPLSDVVVIEAQSFYSRTENPSLFPYVLHNRVTETALHALLLQRTMHTVTIDPNVVRKFFEIKKGKTKNYYSPSILQAVMQEREQRSKKADPKDVEDFVTEHKASVGSKELVTESLGQRRTDSTLFFNNITRLPTRVSLSMQQAQFYLNHFNKGDLGDSLLQGLAFLELEVYRVNYL